MSDQPPSYDPPNQPPQGQPYGGPPQGQPYGGQQYGGQPYGGAPQAGLAHWGQRFGAWFIDGLLYIPASILYVLGRPTVTMDPNTGASSVSGPGILYYVGLLVFLAIFVWNVVLKQGRTGQTVGKGVLNIKLVREADGQPVGPGLSFGRSLLHVLDAIPCYIGFLWPLWDKKRQTFADKIVSTVVVADNAA